MLLTLLWSTDLFQNTFSVMFPYYIKSQAKKNKTTKKSFVRTVLLMCLYLLILR